MPIVPKLPLTLPLLEDPAAIAGVRLERLVERRPGLWSTFDGADAADGGGVRATIVAAALQHADGYAARFERDAPAVVELRHPALVDALDAGRGPRGLHLVTTVPADTPLLDVVDAGSRDPADVLTLLAPVAEALGVVHEAGLVHAAVSPAALRVDAAGRVQLIGLGLCDERTAAADLGPEAAPCVAPELLRGAAPGPEADVFGFAATLWRCLSGGYAREPDDVSAALLGALQHGLVTDPDLRPATASDLVDTLLGRVFGDEATSA